MTRFETAARQYTAEQYAACFAQATPRVKAIIAKAKVPWLKRGKLRRLIFEGFREGYQTAEDMENWLWDRLKAIDWQNIWRIFREYVLPVVQFLILIITIL